MTTHYEPIRSGAPSAQYKFEASGALWLMEVGQYKYGKIALVDGAGLTVNSNNPLVVANEEFIFKGRTGLDNPRTIEFFGLSEGTTMFEARQSEAGPVVAFLQVHVKGLSGKAPTWIALDAPHAAFNAPDTPVPYKLQHNSTINYGENLADMVKRVPEGAKHLVISCHGQPHGVLLIGENLSIDNVKDFSLFKKIGLKVIWIGGCSVAGTPQGTEFCKAIAKNAGCYVVAPGLTIPFVRPPMGRVELFARSLPKYIDPNGNPISPPEFFKQHPKLGFKVE
jgi:hypothetical protein